MRGEKAAVVSGLRGGKYRLLYVSPERLVGDGGAYPAIGVFLPAGTKRMSNRWQMLAGYMWYIAPQYLYYVLPMAVLLASLVTIGLLVALEGLLSADNALVMAVMVLGLPDTQRKQALSYGLVGAFGLRIVATLLAGVFARLSGGQVIDDADRHQEAELFHAWNRAQVERRPTVFVAAAANETGEQAAMIGQVEHAQ